MELTMSSMIMPTILDPSFVPISKDIAVRFVVTALVVGPQLVVIVAVCPLGISQLALTVCVVTDSYHVLPTSCLTSLADVALGRIGLLILISPIRQGVYLGTAIVQGVATSATSGRNMVETLARTPRRNHNQITPHLLLRTSKTH